jgi:hypothetical protein
MKLKKPKSIHRERTPSTAPDVPPDVIAELAPLLRECGPLTACLNDGLEEVMRDPGSTDLERVDAWTMRNAWGNWNAYAVRGPRNPSNPPPDLVPIINRMGDFILRGPGPCFLCEKPVAASEHVPKGWRWHRQCIAIALARDAVEYGSASQRHWGSEVLAGRGDEVR